MTFALTCEQVLEELEAYVLGALDEDQARAISRHIAACDDCARLADEYEQIASLLTLSVPRYRASPRLKERILAGIGAIPHRGVPRILTNRWVLASAASALLAVAIGGIVWAAMLSAEVNRLKTDNARLAELTELSAEDRTALLRLQGQLSSAQSEQNRMSRTLEEQAKLIVLALDPELIPSELHGTSLAPQARCNYVWSGQQGVGALTCKDLPTTSPGLNYELWATKGDKTIPAGSFLPRVDGTASMLVRFPADAEGPVTNLWVTLEQQNQPRARPSNEVVAQRVPSQQAAR